MAAAKRRTQKSTASSSSPRRTRSANATRKSRATVELARGGLRLGNEVLPLRSGAVHYWRLDPSAWRSALAALATMELKLVETYVPWQVHEIHSSPVQPAADRGIDSRPVPPVADPGFFGGESDGEPRYRFDGALDVAAFLREAHALGLKAIVRPGPHINAELTDFGIPERVLWNVECQARTPRQNPVMLPAPPRAFPVPSYASKKFLQETARWFEAVGAELRGLVWPRGPIVMMQIDNEGAMYFRDGIYDQDYHPDAVAIYRRLLERRYGSIGELRRAYGVAVERFDDVPPPTRYDVRSAEDLPRHIDWAESHEVLLADAFADMGRSLEKAGFTGIPLFHNLPMGESATPLYPALVRREGNAGGVDLIALDYYHTAGDHRAIARRTTELAVACDGLDHPAFAAEMGAGAPPFFPPLDEKDAAFTVLCAMAYGIRGYNVYMAVERDRWLGSPVDRNGVVRPFAAFWKKLGAAFDRVHFGDLRRDVPARIVVPRSVRRLARVMHAFGPVSQALFRVMGGGMRETVLEDGIDFGEGHAEPPPMRAGRILVAAERALEEEGIPYTFVDGGDAPHALKDARWILVPTTCGLDASLINAVAAAQKSGAQLAFAPFTPRRDASFRPLSPKAARALPDAHVLAGEDSADAASVRAHLDKVASDLVRFPSSPAPCAVTVHHDRDGVPRVAFVINPTKSRQRVVATIPGVRRLVDLLDGSNHDFNDGVLCDAGSVRFCEVEDGS